MLSKLIKQIIQYTFLQKFLNLLLFLLHNSLQLLNGYTKQYKSIIFRAKHHTRLCPFPWFENQIYFSMHHALRILWQTFRANYSTPTRIVPLFDFSPSIDSNKVRSLRPNEHSDAIVQSVVFHDFQVLQTDAMYPSIINLSRKKRKRTIVKQIPINHIHRLDEYLTVE